MEEVRSEEEGKSTEPVTEAQADLSQPAERPSQEREVLAPPDHSPSLQGRIAVEIDPGSSGKPDFFIVKVATTQGEDAGGEFAVARKSSDFELLRALLVLHWPGVLVPPLPRNKRFEELLERKDTEETNERRRSLLESFLLRLMHIPYLFNTEVVEKFLHTSSDYERSVSSFREVTHIETCNTYIKTFLQYMQEPDPEQPIIIDHYSQVFKEAVAKLEAFRKVAKSMKAYYQTMMENNEKLADAFEAYETDCISEFAKTEEGNYRPIFKRVRKPDYENPYTVIFNWAKTEELEFRAMLEVLEVRNKLKDECAKYESKVRSDTHSLEKLQAGKVTLGSLLTLRPKAEVLAEMEVEVKWDNDQLAAIKKLVVCVTARFIDFEIPCFKVERVRSYKQLMKQYADTSIRELEEMIKVAKAIGLSVV